MTLRTVSPHASRVVRPTDASRRRISGVCSSCTKWNCTFWRVVRWPQPREYVSAMYANISSCSGVTRAVRDLDPEHLVVAALALAVDAVVQPEHAEDVLVDAAVEVLLQRALEDVELFGDDRVEGTSLQFADVDRHGSSLSGGGRSERSVRRARRARDDGATELVGHFVRSTANGDARCATHADLGPSTHGVHATRPGSQMPVGRSGIFPTSAARPFAEHPRGSSPPRERDSRPIHR